MLAGLSDSLTVRDDSAPSSTGPRASPGPGREKSSSWVFHRISSLRFMAYLPLLLVRAFVFPSTARPICCSAFRLWSASLALPTAEPNMPSADFCPPAAPSGRLPACAFRNRSPEVSSAAFRAQSPNLRSACLMGMDFAVTRPLVPRSRLLSGSCPSTRTFAPRFLQTPPRGGSPCASLTLHPHQVG